MCLDETVLIYGTENVEKSTYTHQGNGVTENTSATTMSLSTIKIVLIAHTIHKDCTERLM